MAATHTDATTRAGSCCLDDDGLAALATQVADEAITEQVTRLARILSDANRVRILRALDTASELCVGNIADALGLEQSLVSHHLRSLREASMVTSRREGMWTYYQTADWFTLEPYTMMKADTA